MKSGVFFERDGILNRARVEKQYQATPLTFDEFQLNPEVLDPLRKLKAAGFVLLVTTHQPGLSRGYQSRREFVLPDISSVADKLLRVHNQGQAFCSYG
jgi:D-glycero-D-manno-heptose 1,7-bisphosphate phosphatase